MKIKTAADSIDPQLKRRGGGGEEEEKRSDGLWEQLKLAPSRKSK